MSDDPAELATVDPDETQFRTDTVLMHAELLELELYRIRRELFRDPDVQKVSVGAGQPVEQTLRGHQKDPFNGVIVYNPTPVTLALGFQAGMGVLAPATVPPFSFAAFPQRYVNLSIAVLSTADQQTTVAQPVTVMRTYIPPVAATGPFGAPPAASTAATVPPVAPAYSLVNQAAVANGTSIDNGFPRAFHSMQVNASAGVTGGVVALQGALLPDGLWGNLATLNVNATGNNFVVPAQPTACRFLRASITTAIVGGLVSASLASV